VIKLIEEDLRIKLAKLENKQNGLYNKIYSLNEQINSIRRELEYGRDPCAEGSGVYVVSVNSNYKIGYASDVEARLSDLQVANPFQLRLAIFIPCEIKHAAWLEKRLQRQFQMRNKRGEWFHLKRQDLKEIIQVGEEVCISNVFQWIFRPDELKAKIVPEINTTQDRIIDTIRSVTRENPGQVCREMVIDQCGSWGIDRSTVEELIDQMRRNGDLFEPRPGLLKLP
jgi:hypothetical protein